MQNPNEEKRKRKSKVWLIPLALLIIFTSFLILPGDRFPEMPSTQNQEILSDRYQGMPIAGWVSGIGVPPDCIWSGTAVAWIDENQNGIYETAEQPLQDVVFWVTGIDLDRSTSNWKGEAQLSVWLPGCPEGGFEIYPEIPNGYYLTTTSVMSADAREFDRIFEFGFNTLEGIPTTTARPPSPICKSYQIGIANYYEVTDITVAADGSIWATTFGNGVVHYISEQDKWIRYTVVDGLISNDVYSITALSNGDVWVAASGGASVWNGSEWFSYTKKDGLISREVRKVAQAPDQSIWFATTAGVSHFIPRDNSWTSYTSIDGLAEDFVTYVAATPDNSIWFPTVPEGMTRLILPTSENENMQWITYSEFSEGVNYIPLNFITSIQVAPDGTYWFSDFEGLIQFDPKTETWNFDEIYSENFSQINSFTFSQDGSIWVASGSQSPIIYHLNSQNVWEIYDSRDGLPTIDNVNEDRAESIIVDLNNYVWVATSETATKCVFSGK